MEKKRFGILEWFSIIVFAGMIVLIFGQVIFRYVLNNPLSWSEEVARLLFVFGTFAGAVIALKRGSHISIEAIFEKLPLKLQKLLSNFNYALIIIFMIAVLITSFPILKVSYYTLTGSVRFPVALFYVPITISSVFIIYLTLRKFFSRK